MHPKVAVVTGASSGIGRQIARRLADAGYHVFGTARKPDRVPPQPGVTLLALDVLSDDSVSAFAEQVLAIAGSVDLLVNNAGATLEGAVEETSLDEARQLFETNFFGVIRVTRAFLPNMRIRGAGRVVTIGSVAGFLPKPFEAVYSASKHALEAWSESLDHEVRQFNLRSILIEPGFVRTSIEQNSGSAKIRLEAYQEFRHHAAAIMRADIVGGDEPDVVAKVVLQAATAPRPKVRYLAGKGSLALRLQRTLLPSPLFDFGLRKKFRLP